MKTTPTMWTAGAVLCMTTLAFGQLGQGWDEDSSAAGHLASALDYLAAGVSFSSRYSTGRSSKDTIPPLVIQFSGADREKLIGLEEDLVVMAHLLYKGLEQGLGADSPTVKANIPLLVTGSSRSVRAVYLEGFGALFMIKVNFPVLAPPRFEEKKTDPAADTDWDRARREILNLDQDAEPRVVPTPAPYDASLVDDLKKALLLSLKQAANLRHLKPDEQVAVSAFGSGSVLLAKNTRGAPSPAALASRAKGKPPGDALVEGARAAGLAQVQNNFNAQVEKKAASSNTASVAPTPGDSATRQGKSSASTANSDSDTVSTGVSRRLSSVSRDSDRGTVLAIRTKKSDVDAFARGKLAFEEFAQRAVINAYPGYGHGITSVNSWTKDGRNSSRR